MCAYIYTDTYLRQLVSPRFFSPRCLISPYLPAVGGDYSRSRYRTLSYDFVSVIKIRCDMEGANVGGELKDFRVLYAAVGVLLKFSTRRLTAAHHIGRRMRMPRVKEHFDV